MHDKLKKPHAICRAFSGFVLGSFGLSGLWTLYRAISQTFKRQQDMKHCVVHRSGEPSGPAAYGLGG